MAVSRYQPTTDALAPFFDDLLTPFRRMGSSMRMPDTDVLETEGEIRVLVELPGMKVSDIDLSLENNVLTINGEKREPREVEENGATYHLSERRWGRFSRSFVLPRQVEQDRIEARFEDGVLTVTIPKSEQARRRRIEIHGAREPEEAGRTA